VPLCFGIHDGRHLFVYITFVGAAGLYEAVRRLPGSTTRPLMKTVRLVYVRERVLERSVQTAAQRKHLWPQGHWLCRRDASAVVGSHYYSGTGRCVRVHLDL
jgi:hypothetical protein